MNKFIDKCLRWENSILLAAFLSIYDFYFNGEEVALLIGFPLLILYAAVAAICEAIREGKK